MQDHRRAEQRRDEEKSGGEVSHDLSPGLSTTTHNALLRDSIR
jgi:hypothetical protein